MKAIARAAVLGVVAAGSLAAAQAQDAAAGKSKAAACAVCHGAKGLSVTPDAPNLAGQPAIYLAAWFGSIKVEATAPR